MRSATSSAIPESLPTPDTLVPRSFTTTRALRSARSSTYARPSPRPAPVTTATFPSNEIRSVILLSSCWERAEARNSRRRPQQTAAVPRLVDSNYAEWPGIMAQTPQVIRRPRPISPAKGETDATPDQKPIPPPRHADPGTEAVIKMLDPTYNLRRISVKRRRPNP